MILGSVRDEPRQAPNVLAVIKSSVWANKRLPTVFVDEYLGEIIQESLSLLGRHLFLRMWASERESDDKRNLLFGTYICLLKTAQPEFKCLTERRKIKSCVMHWYKKEVCRERERESY